MASICSTASSKHRLARGRLSFPLTIQSLTHVSQELTLELSIVLIRSNSTTISTTWPLPFCLVDAQWNPMNIPTCFGPMISPTLSTIDPAGFHVGCDFWDIFCLNYVHCVEKRIRAEDWPPIMFLNEAALRAPFKKMQVNYSATFPSLHVSDALSRVASTSSRLAGVYFHCSTLMFRFRPFQSHLSCE